MFGWHNKTWAVSPHFGFLVYLMCVFVPQSAGDALITYMQNNTRSSSWLSVLVHWSAFLMTFLIRKGTLIKQSPAATLRYSSIFGLQLLIKHLLPNLSSRFGVSISLELFTIWELIMVKTRVLLELNFWIQRVTFNITHRVDPQTNLNTLISMGHLFVWLDLMSAT